MVDAPALRIVYFGTPAFAVPSLEALIASRHPVVAVISQPDRPRGRGQQLQSTATKQTAEAHGIPVIQPAKIRDEAFLETIRRLQPDLGVVAAFGRILPDELLNIPRLGMINVHASLLPKYRGAAPIQRAVLAGETETGVSIMRVVRELDAGPTFLLRSLPIAPDATSGDVEAVVARLGAEAVLPVVDDLAAGRAVETPQDDAKATLAPKVTKDEGTVDWGDPATTIHNRVRGLQPWPLAATTIGGQRVVLRRSRPVESNETGGAGTGDPGQILLASGDELVVRCGNGTQLRVLDLQPEGKRTMSAREFLAGRKLTTRDRFGT